MADPLWISEAEVTSLLDLREAIVALEAGLRDEAGGRAAPMAKTWVPWGRAGLHAIGAAFPAEGIAGTKTWAHAGGDSNPLVILFDTRSGGLLAVIEAFALGQMRTAAMSGVATRWLARPDAGTLALVGTGKQALAQVAAVAAVRRLAEVRVYSPNAEHRASFVQRLADAQASFAVREATSVGEAARGAGIVTLVTRATEPFLESAVLARGAHVNAVGAITPERAEVAPDVFGRSDVVAVDTLAGVRELSREFIDYYTNGPGDWQTVRTIAGIVSAREGRPAGADLTLFKAMGTGVADLSLAIAIYRGALERGAGRALAAPRPASPRLWGATLETEELADVR
jgi:ornithine cyclodeaminase